jgi:hypothetical protein
LIAYADASFLASLYLADRNSAEALRALRAHSATVLISEFGLLEAVSAFTGAASESNSKRMRLTRSRKTFAGMWIPISGS